MSAPKRKRKPLYGIFEHLGLAKTSPNTVDLLWNSGPQGHAILAGMLAERLWAEVVGPRAAAGEADFQSLKGRAVWTNLVEQALGRMAVGGGPFDFKHFHQALGEVMTTARGGEETHG